MTNETESQEIETSVQNAEKPDTDSIMTALSDDSVSEDSKEKVDEADQPKTKESTGKESEQDEKNNESESEAKPEAEQDSNSDKEEKELDEEETRKEQARRGYEEREKVRSERRERVAKQTQNYIEEGEDDKEQRLRAMEVQQYNQVIEHTENNLINEFERAKANPDLQMFNPESKEFNVKLYDWAIKQYNNGQINYDENGNMIGVKGSLYKHLTETADLYRDAIKSGAFQQIRDQRTMKAKSDVKPSVAPKEKTKDLIMDTLTSDD